MRFSFIFGIIRRGWVIYLNFVPETPFPVLGNGGEDNIDNSIFFLEFNR